eukprot:6123546-Pyramimonas_sp.AAC.2
MTVLQSRGRLPHFQCPRLMPSASPGEGLAESSRSIFVGGLHERLELGVVSLRDVRISAEPTNPTTIGVFAKGEINSSSSPSLRAHDSNS